MDQESAQYSMDIFDTLLKGGRTTAFNADLIMMEQNSMSEPQIMINHDQIKLDQKKISANEEIQIELKGTQKEEEIVSGKNEEDEESLIEHHNLSITQKKGIFSSKIIRKEGKKNTNLPKFFVRMLMKYWNEYESTQEVEKKFQELEPGLKNRKTNNFNMKDVLQLLGDFESDQSIGKVNRKSLRKILRDKLKQEVILSPRVSYRSTYMLTAKIFALRCMNRDLTHRLQFR